eukprot:symbB.v1.2.041106.t1/scaffold7829.1/size9131/1
MPGSMARRNSMAATFAMAPGFDEGKWREFRPSSSWVFGSWEVGNSGSRDSKIFEIPKYKNIQRATI